MTKPVEGAEARARGGAGRTKAGPAEAPPPRAALSDEQLDNLRLALSRPYFERPSDKRLREQLGQALREDARAPAADDPARRPRLIMATGRTGAGKSRALRRLIDGFPELAWSADRRVRPHVRLSVMGPATLKSVGLGLLDVLGYPMSPETREHVVWTKVRQQFASAGTKLVVFDEFQNCSSRANADESVRIRDTIKSLLTSDDPLIVVLAGLPEIGDFVRKDGQVLRRARTTGFETIELEDADVVTQAVAMLAAMVDLVVPDDFGVGIVPRLLHAAGGQLGLAIEMSVDALVNALAPIGTDEEGDEVRLPPRGCLLLDDFARVYEERTDNMSFANVFAAEEWHLIDPTLVNVHLPSQLRPAGDGAQASAKAGNRRRGGSR